MALYSEKVMDHFRNPRNVGVLENPDGVGEVGNPVCGDIMKIYLQIDNDIITDVNGTAITSSDELVDVVRAAAAGDKLTMTVYRQGETVELTVEVGEQIQSALPEPEEPTQDSSQQGQQMLPWGFGNN